jgi:hypothetical protein
VQVRCRRCLLAPSPPPIQLADFGSNAAGRMMSGPVFLLAPLKHIDRFFVRLDADSHVTRPVTKRTDALAAAAAGGQKYVFWSVAVETCRWGRARVVLPSLFDVLLVAPVARWMGHNCSHMHDIARAHLRAAGADFNAEMFGLFRRQVCCAVVLEPAQLTA